MAKADSSPESKNSTFSGAHLRQSGGLFCTCHGYDRRKTFCVGRAANTRPHLREYARRRNAVFWPPDIPVCHPATGIFPTDRSIANEFRFPHARHAAHRLFLFRSGHLRTETTAQPTQPDGLPQRRLRWRRTQRIHHGHPSLVRQLREHGAAGRSHHEPVRMAPAQPGDGPKRKLLKRKRAMLTRHTHHVGAVSSSRHAVPECQIGAPQRQQGREKWTQSFAAIS